MGRLDGEESSAEPAERDEPPRWGPGVRHRDIVTLQTGIGMAETAIYLVVGAMLVVAAAFTLAGTAVDLVEGAASRDIDDAGVFLLDRILLLFIIAELLFTLRVVNFGGRIHVEPFLFIGLIAVVRKVLVLTAEAEEDEPRFLAHIGALAGLALVLTVSIYLLRRSSSVR